MSEEIPFSLSKEVDAIQKLVFERKMKIPAMKTERDRLVAIRELFPLHFKALSDCKAKAATLLCFRLAFLDWADYVSRHIKSDEIAIKDPEIDSFRETLTTLFALCGEHRAVAYQLAKSPPTREEIERKFGSEELIREVEALGDPQFERYLEELRAQGPIFPKLEELIDECNELAQDDSPEPTA